MRKIGPIALALGTMLSSASYAQVAADPPTPVGSDVATASPDAAPDEQGTDIVVTAQRRTESLQDTPIAVTAVTAGVVQSLGLGEIQDIAAITPGASFTVNNNFFAPYIRGIGTNYVSVGVEAPVAIYEDGAYLVRTLSVNEILENFDIGSIQVLRGPQGTLYGRNATGGVIIINSADPTPDIEARLRGEYGNLDQHSLNGMVNLPVGQDMALRVSGGYRHDGDYIFSTSTGEGRGGGRAYNVRAKLRWTPGSADIILGGQYYDTSYRSGPNTLARNDDTCLGCQLNPDSVPASPKFYDFTGDLSLSPLRAEYYGANLSMTFDMGDFELSSVTTYRHQEMRDSAGDSDLTPAPLFEFAVPESGGESWTQDFQVTSKLDGSFNYLFGLSFLHDEGFFNPCFLGAFFGGSTDPDTAGCFDNDTTTTSYAAFLEGYYQITDTLRVTAGGRYTYEERSARGATNDVLGMLFGAGGGFSFELSETQRAFTPRFVLAWDNGPTNIYYSFTRGFKAGGFPGPFVFPVAAVDPEKIASHEIGVKHRMFDGALRLNVAAFHFKNKNQQVQSLDPLTSATITQNSGALENYGVEVEVQVVPIEGLNLGLNAAWQHARYKPFENAAQVCFDPTRTGGTLYACNLDLTGTAPAHAPEWSGSLNASYQFSIASWTAQLAGIAEYRSGINYFAGAGGPLRFDRDGDRFLANASGYISPPGENFRIGFYVNNLFDRQYVTYRQTVAPYGLSYNAAKPRTYGLRLEYAF